MYWISPCTGTTSSSGGGGGTDLSLLIFAANDEDALSKGVVLGGFYKVNSTTTTGLPAGTIKQCIGTDTDV